MYDFPFRRINVESLISLSLRRALRGTNTGSCIQIRVYTSYSIDNTLYHIVFCLYKAAGPGRTPGEEEEEEEVLLTAYEK